MRCFMCDEPDVMYIPSDDVDDYGLYSCTVCDFELEGFSERYSRPAETAHGRLGRPIPIAVAGLTASPYVR